MKSEKSNLSVFENWSWFVLEDLPLEYVVRIMDCLLLEGPKVLYRFGLALFGSFTRDKAKSLKGTSRDSVMQAIRTYCRQMRYPPQKILREAFSIRGFSRSEIQRLKAKIEEQIKAGVFGASGEYSADPCGPPEDTDPQTPDCDSDSSSTIELWRKIEIKAGLCEFAGGQLIQSRSTEGIPSSAAQQAISMTSNTLSIKQGMSTPQPLPRNAAAPRGENPFLNFKCLLTSKQLLILWGWLPMRITMYQPHLLYTTDVHGCSLSTLYNKAQAYEPTILIVKTLDGDIFGAYCSSPWSDRNAKNEMTGYRHTYFGTGETFLFSLYPECRRYSWVGKTSSKGVAHSEELFMAADSHMITVGGGNGQGLWIDSEIRYGKTERCDTFGNEPLTAKKDFEVQVLEVYGFTSEA
ncbi:unnamed protein product [Cyprideis torosa]|uniref:Uncharacterized protein n=1 Tax=Cyprideis torosa TaxID=163714 RepID=A0A7R8WA72_9CRUS|nr:unnamed protein product [Cyprideis torosa]CAG0890677.1 unnamed protein product [Cyprideis torosa]